MKKRILAVLSAILVAGTLSGTIVLAQDGVDRLEAIEASDDYTTMIDLNQCFMYRQLADGSIIPVMSPRLPITQHTIEAGETMYYSASDGSDFWIYKDFVVEYQATFSSTSSYECGYYLDGDMVPLKSGNARSFKVAFTAEEDGDYQFYITNNSSDTITVKSGYIRY